MRIGWTRWLVATLGLYLVFTTAALAQQGYRMEDAVKAASSRVRPSVVAIETRFEEPLLSDRYAFWQYFRGSRPLYGLWGSGFIYKDPNYVITSSFLMEHAKFVRVILDDGRSYAAELVDTNKTFHIAVLKVDWGPDLEPISPPFGDSDKLVLGQPIAIVGKALNSVDTFATAGIISAIRKQIPGADEPTDQFLQFDAVYELSFTGAPLVDVVGNVVGMVYTTIGMSDFSVSRMNLGVPINDVVYIADRIIAKKVFEVWFGVEQIKLTAGIQEQGMAPKTFDWNGDGKAEAVDFGMWVTYVEPNSPADIAGLKEEDLIVEIDGKLMKFDYDWDRMMRSFEIGQLVTVSFIRKNATTGNWERMETQVQILEKPSEDKDKEKDKGKDTGKYKD